MPQTIAELEPLIIEWANEKGLILHTKEQALKQHGKTEEEIQEFLEAKAELDNAIVKKCESGMWAHRELQHKLRLEAGDILVTLVIQCAINSQESDLVSLGECVDIHLQYQIDPTIKRNNYDLNYRAGSLGNYIANSEAAVIVDGIGGLATSLNNTIRHYELTLDECLEAAWLKIRDRTGRTIDGVFIKADDLATAAKLSELVGDELSGLFQ